jgi:hypothetical protein
VTTATAGRTGLEELRQPQADHAEAADLQELPARDGAEAVAG